MDDSFSDITIFNDVKILKKFLENYSDDIINTIDFDNDKVDLKLKIKIQNYLVH
jgi:hypothetical protein